MKDFLIPKRLLAPDRLIFVVVIFPELLYSLKDKCCMILCSDLEDKESMKLTKIQKFSWIGCPWLFGTVLLVAGLVIPAGDHPVVKTLNIGLALVLFGLYGTNSLLARLVEKDAANELIRKSEQTSEADAS